MSTSPQFTCKVYYDPHDKVWVGSIIEMPGTIATGFTEQEVLERIPISIAKVLPHYLCRTKPQIKKSTILESLADTVCGMFTAPQIRSKQYLLVL